MTREELLYRRIKSVALRYGKDKDFIAFVMDGQHGKVFHHACGSTMGRKTTDYLGCAVDPIVHTESHDDRDWLYDQLPDAIDNLLKYVVYLKSLTAPRSAAKP